MTLRRLVVLTVLAIAGTAVTQVRSDWVIREDGVSSIRIGMTLRQLNTVLHENFSLPQDKEEQACFYVDSAKHPHISFMVVNGRVARIDVDRPGVFTAKGIQVGDSEADAVRAYGRRLKIEPHAYTGPEGHYLTVRPGDGRYGIRFETDGKTITMFYAGRFDAIQYIEGCQ